MPQRLPEPAPLDISPLGEGDLAQLFGLARAAFASLAGWSDLRVLDLLERDVVFVARERGEPAGYVAVHKDGDVATVVDQLLVAPGHEARGIGHRLLAYAEGYAISEHTRTLRIVVEEGNDSARDFYRRFGFVPVETEVFELVLPRED